MPRAISIDDDAHRLEQEAYRERLESRGEPGTKGEPEIGKADTAVTMAVYWLVRETERQLEGKGARALERFVEKAADVLEAEGYDRDRAEFVLRRRLAVPKQRFDRLLGLPKDESNVFVITP